MKTTARILIVEDESLVADDLQQRLEELGFRPIGIVDTAENAIKRAVELRPDLVLMDVHLKGRMDGIEAAVALRQPHDIPVVFLTSHADLDTLERAGVSEPFGYLTKPFQERDLLATVKMALARREAESRLRKLERWLSTTLNSIGDAVIATDVSGRVTYMNPVAETMTGWKLDESVGRSWADVFRLSDAGSGQPIRNLVNRSLTEGIVVELGGETNLMTRNGNLTPVDDSVAPIRDEGNAPCGCVIVFRDASERRKMEQSVRQHDRQLEERVQQRTAELEAANLALRSTNEELRQKSQEIEVICYAISHDLRAPLRAINGYACLLEQEHSQTLDEGAAHLLNFIIGNSRKMGEMIDGFLGLIRLGKTSLVRGRVDMTALAREVVETLKAADPASRAQISVQVLPVVEGDPVLLRQVWHNLIENALKFSSRSETPWVWVEGHWEGGEVVYEVRDNGVGFDSASSGRLFQIFQRLHSEQEFGGHGIGLAHAHRIVGLHGGRMSAEGNVGRGSIFRFILPGEVPQAPKLAES
ncbi:MAG: response regulator [Verrucomicrobia bacterium]|nr:response regulator [Verrucomicrobiota bacterium]